MSNNGVIKIEFTAVRYFEGGGLIGKSEVIFDVFQNPVACSIKKHHKNCESALHKLPGNSSLNVRSVFPVCPVRPGCPGFPICPDDHDDHKDHEDHDEHDDYE